MIAPSREKPNCASSEGGTLCTGKSDFVHLNLSLAHCAKAVFVKPAATLMQMLNLGERDAKYRLSAKRKFTAAEIASLLQSEHGLHFLVVLMDRARPKWWRAVLRMGVLGTIEQRRRADLKLLRRAFHADNDTTAAFSDAFRVQDPDFYRAVLAGHDEATGFDDLRGPVAPTKGDRR